MTIAEIAIGLYPYAAERYDSIYARLYAVQNGLSPVMPSSLSSECIEFIESWYALFRIIFHIKYSSSLAKNPAKRPLYSDMLVTNEKLLINSMFLYIL